MIPVAARSANKYDLVLALLDLDLYDQLMDAINASGRRAQLQWENTAIVSEDDPLVKALVQGLGWDAATIDRIFGKIDKGYLMDTDLKTNLNALGNKVYYILVNIAVAIYVLAKMAWDSAEVAPVAESISEGGPIGVKGTGAVSLKYGGPQGGPQ